MPLGPVAVLLGACPGSPNSSPDRPPENRPGRHARRTHPHSTSPGRWSFKSRPRPSADLKRLVKRAQLHSKKFRTVFTTLAFMEARLAAVEAYVRLAGPEEPGHVEPEEPS